MAGKDERAMRLWCRVVRSREPFDLKLWAVKEVFLPECALPTFTLGEGGGVGLGVKTRCFTKEQHSQLLGEDSEIPPMDSECWSRIHLVI